MLAYRLMFILRSSPIHMLRNIGTYRPSQHTYYVNVYTFIRCLQLLYHTIPNALPLFSILSSFLFLHSDSHSRRLYSKLMVLGDFLIQRILAWSRIFNQSPLVVLFLIEKYVYLIFLLVLNLRHLCWKSLLQVKVLCFWFPSVWLAPLFWLAWDFFTENN